MKKMGETLAERIATIHEKSQASKIGPKHEPKPKKVSLEKKPLKRPRKWLPNRHQNLDFFTCDLFDYALKEDGASMEAPIFTLSTKPDLSSWFWQSADGHSKIEVYPSIKGRATQFDKDVLIYVISQMTAALNQDRQDAQNRTVRFRVHDYLVSTNKPTGGIEYSRLEMALDRLRGTTIKTDIRTGGARIREGFGIIDSWRIIEKSPTDERMIAVSVTLSQWLYNAVQAHEVLTMNKDYFRLRKPMERRLYELARKHCGKQTLWRIGLELLQGKCGSKSSLKRFRQAMRQIIADGTIPDYRLELEDATDQVTVFKRN